MEYKDSALEKSISVYKEEIINKRECKNPHLTKKLRKTLTKFVDIRDNITSFLTARKKNPKDYKLGSEKIGFDTEELKKISQNKKFRSYLKQYNRYRERVIVSSQGFLNYFALRYSGNGLQPSDLLQEANIGLMRGLDKINKYKLAGVVAFGAYIPYYIKRQIQVASGDGKIIHLGPNRIFNLISVSKIIGELSQEKKRNPTMQEIIKEMRKKKRFISINEIKEILTTPFTLSLEDKINSDSESNLMDIIPSNEFESPSTIAEKNEHYKELNAFLDKNLITQRALLIRVIFGINYPLTINEIENRFSKFGNLTPKRRPFDRTRYCVRTFEETAKIFGITRQRVEQKFTKSIKILKKNKEKFIYR